MEMGSSVAKDFGRELVEQDPVKFVVEGYEEGLKYAVGRRTRAAAKKAMEQTTSRAGRAMRNAFRRLRNKSN